MLLEGWRNFFSPENNLFHARGIGLFCSCFLLLLLHKWQFVKKWQIKANCCGTKIHLFFNFLVMLKLLKKNILSNRLKKNILSLLHFESSSTPSFFFQHILNIEINNEIINRFRQWRKTPNCNVVFFIFLLHASPYTHIMYTICLNDKPLGKKNTREYNCTLFKYILKAKYNRGGAQF